MALVVKDRVKETTTTTGTGTVTLLGAVTGFQSFSSVGNANTTYYTISDGTNWEVGIGTYTSAGSTLSRDTVLSSSNSGSLVNFGAGTKEVFVTYPASKSVYQDGTDIKANTSILAVANGGTGASSAASALTNLGAYPSSNPSGYTNNTGTVTSVSGSGGTTGLTLTGGPITTSGTLTLAGTLVAANGGTGQSSYTVGDILYASGSTALSKLADVATGNALISGGVGVAPSYGKIGLTTHVSGTLAVGNGGTGATTLTANGVLYGNGTSAVAATAAGTTGQVLVGNTGAAPSWSAASSVGVTSIGFGTTGLEPFVATKGDIVVTGTLAASSGGTGATTLASGYLLKGNGTSAVSASVVYDTGTNVGIGTSAPGYKLVVSAASNTNPIAVISGSTKGIRLGADANGGIIEGVDNTGAASYQPMTLGGADIRLTTSSTERMRIDSSGNVGIATSTPQTRFEVYGGLIAGSENRQTHPNANAAGGFKAQWNYSSGSAETDLYNLYSTATESFRFYQTTGSGTAQILYSMLPTAHLFYTGGSERMRIDSSGNVGIGTSSPSQKLTLQGAQLIIPSAGWSSGQVAYMYLGDTNNGVSATNGSYQTYFSFNGHNWLVNGTEAMRIDGSRSVGIGTTTPQCIFNVKTGTAWVQNYSGSASSPVETVDWPVPAITATSYGNYALQTMMAFALPNDGNYFTGNSVWTIRLNQTASSTTSAGVNGLEFIGPGYLVLGAGQNERMRITSGGDVAIGATTASGKLHVETTSTGDTIYIAANTGGTAGQSVYVIPVRTAGTLRGGIQWNGTNLLYNNSSDARLKDNVADADDASSLIDAIQVRKFDWKESGTHQRYGFIAQELVEVAPEAVHQPEDEEEMMGVDYSKLVPMMIKEMQSMRARIAELEGK